MNNCKALCILRISVEKYPFLTSPMKAVEGDEISFTSIEHNKDLGNHLLFLHCFQYTFRLTLRLPQKSSLAGNEHTQWTDQKTRHRISLEATLSSHRQHRNPLVLCIRFRGKERNVGVRRTSKGPPLNHALANNRIVRYPTCLRTEIDSNAVSLSARHPNLEIRISITHRLVDNPTTSGPYNKTTAQASRSTTLSFPSIFSPYL